MCVISYTSNQQHMNILKKSSSKFWNLEFIFVSIGEKIIRFIQRNVTIDRESVSFYQVVVILFLTTFLEIITAKFLNIFIISIFILMPMTRVTLFHVFANLAEVSKHCSVVPWRVHSRAYA